LFGVVLERAGPGVVLDAIGIQGARIRFLDKQDDAHWAEQLRSRSPDLVIYEFGANESGDGFLYSMTDYHRTMRDVIEQEQRALPEASCLVVGAMDRAARQGESIVSVRVIPSLVEEQRKVAAELGCGFFDTYVAMGGKGSMPI
jgi:lysophospholipase L1-like esterase